MSYYNEWENIRARISGARDKPSRWSECRFNTVVDKDSTCGEEGYVMCGEDSTASVGPSGDLKVEVLGSKHITQPCDDGVVLSALVTVECGGSSEVICPRSEVLDTTQSRHCMDESSFFPPSLFPSPPTSPARPSPPPPPPPSSPPPSAPLPSPLPTPTPTKPSTSASSLTSSSTVTTSTKSATTPSKPSPPNPPSWSQPPPSQSAAPPSPPPPSSSPPPPPCPPRSMSPKVANDSRGFSCFFGIRFAFHVFIVREGSPQQAMPGREHPLTSVNGQPCCWRKIPVPIVSRYCLICFPHAAAESPVIPQVQKPWRDGLSWPSSSRRKGTKEF